MQKPADTLHKFPIKFPLLLADAGSTHTDWCLLLEGEAHHIKTAGLNPVYLSDLQLQNALEHAFQQFLPKEVMLKPAAIRFFGAGAKNEDAERLSHALQALSGTKNIEVASDLEATRIACIQDNSGVACILGTGSNSAYYHNGELQAQRPSLGFLLGDEGSGSWLGKELLRAHLYQDLPIDLTTALTPYLPKYTTYLQWLKSPTLNQNISALSALLQPHSEHPWVQSLIKTGFKLFVNHRVLPYLDTEAKKLLPIHASGSVVYAYRNLFSEVLVVEGLHSGTIVQNPMQGLISYYSQHQ